MGEVKQFFKLIKGYNNTVQMADGKFQFYKFAYFDDEKEEARESCFRVRLGRPMLCRTLDLLGDGEKGIQMFKDIFYISLLNARTKEGKDWIKRWLKNHKIHVDL